jgi:hypothetical protein
MTPKYRYWRAQPLWTLSEAAYLLAGHSPLDDPRDAWTHPPTEAETFHARIKMAIATGDIESTFKVKGVREESVKPSDVVRWAQTRKYHVPGPLRMLVTQGADRNDLSTRERNTLLKLVLGMAEAKYGYDPAATHNDAIKRISGDLAQRDLSVSDDTVRKWLTAAQQELRTG